MGLIETTMTNLLVSEKSRNDLLKIASTIHFHLIIRVPAGGGGLIDGFNAECKNIAASFLKVGDESMSAIRFRTTAKGNLPHLSYIFCVQESCPIFYRGFAIH